MGESAPVSVVVGANGFLGRTLAARLLARGDRVVGVVGVGRDRVPVGVSVTDQLPSPGDVDDAATVYVTAAFIPYGAMDRSDPRLFETNVALVHRVSARWPRARLVFASSVAVYGEATGVRTEGSASVRRSLYGESKLAGELPARLHVSHAVLRFSSLVGVGMDARTFVPRAVAEARRARTITLWGDGSRRADYFHVEDAVDLCVAAGESSENGTFLGVSGASIENRAVAAHIAEKLPGTALVFSGDDASPSVEYDASGTWARLGARPKRTVFQAAEELCVDG